jgi:hypothetical protein
MPQTKTGLLSPNADMQSMEAWAAKQQAPHKQE